jgi:hypothetical protein
MASGDFTVFDQCLVDLGNKQLDMDTDTFKFALIDSVITPTAADSNPRWAVTSGVDYDGNECTPGGNYTAAGETLSTPVWSVTANILKWDVVDVSILQHASNPTDARWAIIYSDTHATKNAIGFLDLGSVRDLSGGDFSWTVPTNGVFRIGVGTIT